MDFDVFDDIYEGYGEWRDMAYPPDDFFDELNEYEDGEEDE